MLQEETTKELSRCLGCKIKPCEKACPLGVSPHDFIASARQGKFTAAALKIASKNPLPQTCGLACPDKFCQKSCIRSRIDKSVEIPCLQAEIIRHGGYPLLTFPPLSDKKAAIIGGGPAGIGAAFELLKNGWLVDIYEKSSSLGGAARLIPEYRLPKSVLDSEINRIIRNERTNVFLNKEITDFKQLKKEYDGCILALGETKLQKLNVKGEEFCISYIDYLNNPQKIKAKKIAVSGGGEVAVDCALTAKKNGCECVEMFVRRRKTDMRIQEKEILELERFGIIVRELTSIKKINKVSETFELCTIRNRINDIGKAEPLAETEGLLAGYDHVIQALGAFFPKENLPQDFIIAGDMTGSCGTIVQALASGRDAAQKLLKGNTE